MEVNLLAFGITRDIFRASSLTINIREGSVLVLKQELENAFPELKQLSTYMVAVNNEYASDATVLSDKDEVAIIPPVSGG